MSSFKRGWKWLYNSRKWHYFIEGRSLCGKFAVLSDAGTEDGNDNSPDNCAPCRKAVAKLREREAGRP